MAQRRRRYQPYDPRFDPRFDPRYDPRYGPYPRGGYGPGYGYGYRGNSCLRDACLLQTGCCLAESLDGNCLLAAVLLAPQFARAFEGLPGRGGTASRIVGAIRVYQREISAHRRPVCRFTPSCSEYAAQAVEWHGAWRGSVLAGRRLLRCRPAGPRGLDPVPV